MKKNENRETAPGAPIAWESPSQPEEVQPGYGYVADNNETEETFYYHSDHLGSTSYITDDSAHVTQYTAYLPYGELLVDEHSSSEDMPYKFNGKELDEETGLYYYGARYMQPITSVWYSIDPLTEKYPDVSAYVYCMGNPVKLVDSDGLFPKKLLNFHKTSFFRKDYYTFTTPMAHTLSLVSGINEQDIKNAKIYERSVSNPYPWYIDKNTYGGITLPEGGRYAITFTNNLFDDSELGQKYFAWLNISSHEVGHIKHIKDCNKKADTLHKLLLDYSIDPREVPSKEWNRLETYITTFAASYIKHNGHNDSPLEIEAEKGSETFRKFNKYINTHYGKNALLRLLMSDKSDSQKIQIIDKYWNEYNKIENR